MSQPEPWRASRRSGSPSDRSSQASRSLAGTGPRRTAAVHRDGSPTRAVSDPGSGAIDSRYAASPSHSQRGWRRSAKALRCCAISYATAADGCAPDSAERTSLGWKGSTMTQPWTLGRERSCSSRSARSATMPSRVSGAATRPHAAATMAARVHSSRSARLRASAASRSVQATK